MLAMLYRNRPSFVVLTGKRRVGKTELIKRFSENKKALYLFVDSNKSREIQLSEYEEYIRTELGLPDYVRFRSFGELFEFILDHRKDLIVAFDEFQRFLKVDGSAVTELQKLWDLKGSSSRVLLLTSGSSIGMIKKIFIDRGAPLFKRADNMINLSPFGLKDIFDVLDDLGIDDIEEKLDIYFLFGGTIYYYKLMEKYEVISFKDALDKLILNELAPLRHEVRDILVEEFGKEHATYYEILSAMAMGKSTKKEIGDATHISQNSLSPYFYDLIELLQIAEYMIPVTETRGKTKKGRYILRDNFFRFYFKFIYRNMNHYVIGNYDIIREKIVSGWNEFRGRIWEDIVIDFMKRTMSVEYPEIGRFWDRRGNEIDIVGINKRTGEVFMAEIKLNVRSAADSLRIINDLQKKSDLIPFNARKIRYGIIAPKIKGREMIEKKGFFTYTLDDILKGPR